MRSTPPQVRPAEARDARAIAEVHVQSWRETYTGMLPERLLAADSREPRQRMWESILNSDPLPGSIAVALQGDELIGFAYAGSSENPDATKGIAPARDVHLYSLYLLSNKQGAGTGRALLEAVLRGRAAQLWVLKENHAARAFYERQGFREDGSEYADPDIDGLTEIRMVR